jgi:cysteinyl-tRNA synthetase
MPISLYNSLTRRTEAVCPLDPKRVTMYLCGPTVYNYVHIGNARGPVVFDVLARLLRRHYPNVVYARNITDVEDKINAPRSAKVADRSPSPIATRWPIARTWPDSASPRPIWNRTPPPTSARSSR